MATYVVPISQFPGGVAPVSFGEFVQRVKDDVGISKVVISPELKYTDFGVAPKVSLYFNAALSPAEETIVDNLAAASPGAVAATTSDWLAALTSELFSGHEADLTAATESSGTPAVRMDEDKTLAGGVYSIEWHATVYGTGTATDYTARFVLARGEVEEVIAAYSSEGDQANIFSGYFRVTLPAGTYSFELEIDHDGGGGDAAMMDSEFHYSWVGSA